MSWFRQEAAFFQNPNVVLAGWHGSIVFLVACHMSKLHGWDGIVPKRHFTPDLIRRFCGAPIECHSDTDLLNGIARCVESELFAETDSSLKIRNWSKYQPDPTALARKRKQRAKSKPVTAGHSDVTTQTDRQTHGTDGHNQTDAAVADLSSSAPLPFPGVASAGLHKSQRLTETAWVSVDAILQQMVNGAVGKAEQIRGLQLRTLRRSGALGDDIGSALLDQYKARFKVAIGEAKLKARKKA